MTVRYTYEDCEPVETLECPDFRREDDIWDFLEREEEEMLGLREWQYAREMEVALENAIEEGDMETLYLLRYDKSVSGEFRQAVKIAIDCLSYINIDRDESNFRRWWNSYFSTERKGGKFSRVQVQKRYQAKGDFGWRTREERDCNASKFRFIKKSSARLDNAEFLGNKSLDTNPRVLAGGSWTFGSEEPAKIVRAKVTPYSRAAPAPEVEIPENSVRTKQSRQIKRQNYRTRHCSPCTSKSSAFSAL